MLWCGEVSWWDHACSCFQWLLGNLVNRILDGEKWGLVHWSHQGCRDFEYCWVRNTRKMEGHAQIRVCPIPSLLNILKGAYLERWRLTSRAIYGFAFHWIGKELKLLELLLHLLSMEQSTQHSFATAAPMQHVESKSFFHAKVGKHPNQMVPCSKLVAAKTSVSCALVPNSEHRMIEMANSQILGSWASDLRVFLYSKCVRNLQKWRSAVLVW